MSTSDPRSTVEETETREPVAWLGQIGGHRFLVFERDGAVGPLAKEVEWTPLAALRTPERQQGWRTIDSAPRDGTYVLACWWGAENPQDRDYEPSVVAWASSEFPAWRDCYGADYNEPTHWGAAPTRSTHHPSGLRGGQVSATSTNSLVGWNENGNNTPIVAWRVDRFAFHRVPEDRRRCSVCGRSFVFATGLARHVRIKHADSSERKEGE